jgi:Flp pilus assembly protein TadB
MTAHAFGVLAAVSAGWWVGYSIGLVVVAAVVALVVPILLLAHAIGKESPLINQALEEAVEHTAPLAALGTTIDHAEVITAGLARGRARLGG